MTTFSYNDVVDTLPDTLSGLIRVALADFRKCLASNDYVVDMREWHAPVEGDALCRVCLAGAVMAQTLQVPVEDEVSPTRFSLSESQWGRESQLENKLRAINSLRVGEVRTAARVLLRNGLLTQARAAQVTPASVNICCYTAGPNKFFRDLEELATTLETNGY